MKADDRARLTTALRDHVAKIAAELRAKMRAPGAARVASEQLHKDERVAEDFEVWTDLLSRRAAVLWVLKSVYVRVLEDRGLLQPGRLLDPEAQQLFEKLAPNLGETAFLRWIYRDLASTRGGVPELFSPQPTEVALPSDELSRALIALWRHRDADTGAVWSFAEERFEGELMGDLYQELDPVVKDRFALCQTPDFVRAFILDRTLTPAIETFGADDVRLLDPACGSGHFLIDGLKRLVAVIAEEHKDWSKEKVVVNALDRVVGIDLNDYACALARTRLIMTAAELAGVTKLADTARFHPHVYWADGLEQVEREEVRPKLQTDLFTKVEVKPRATLTRSDVRGALRKVFEKKFHAVVANPPYIVESDAARKDYHREKLGKQQRYVSAYRQYSLGSPFTERCFQLAENDGLVGIITSNNFLKREFGKPLIEKVLAKVDLTLIVDTSQAYIPFHGTPTVLLFGTNHRPKGKTVRVVMGKRGESGTPDEPAKGKVWSSLDEGWSQPGYENDYVSVADLARETLAKHPWSLGGGGAAELKERLERIANQRLKDCTKDIGRTNVCGEDPVFIMSPAAALRLGAAGLERPLTIGEVVRDWTSATREFVLYPYQSMGGDVIADSHPSVSRYFWRFRTLLRTRSVFGKSTEQRGGAWFEHLEHYADRLRTPLSIAFAFVSTHNQFVLDRGGRVFNRSAPVIKLPGGASEDDHLALLGLLNSSTLGFWMRQVFHVKGGESTGKRRQSEVWSRRLEFDATKLSAAPVVTAHRARIVELARRLDALAQQYSALDAANVLARHWSTRDLASALDEAKAKRRDLREQQVAAQEELDWTSYVAFGLAAEAEAAVDIAGEQLASEHRPFAIRLARAAASGEATNYWFEAMAVSPSVDVPSTYSKATRSRIERRVSLIENDSTLSMLEAPEYKRKWEPTAWNQDVKDAAFSWLAARVEAVVAQRGHALSLPQIVAAIQDDARLLAIAALYQERRDVDLGGLVGEIMGAGSVPSHRFHIYTESGLTKRAAWEEVWQLQRREDAGEKVPSFPTLPEYSQGSRGKSSDFLRTEYWQIRGRLDVPTERFVAFTEVPRRSGVETLYGWAGWTDQQHMKAILAIDEELEDASVPLGDRIGLLDSAWRLLPDVARENAAAATRLKAELKALVGPEGPSAALIEDWKKRFPPPTTRAAGARRPATGKAPTADVESADNLPTVIPNVLGTDDAALFIWALLHASGGRATRMDLARAFALRARPNLLKRLAPASLKREVTHWASTVGSRSVKAGLLASTLGALVEQNGVLLGTNGESRATVSTSPFTPAEEQIEPWFRFEAELAMKVLRAQPEEKFSAIDKSLSGADRKLLENAA
jgi:hypothetical protein